MFIFCFLLSGDGIGLWGSVFKICAGIGWVAGGEFQLVGCGGLCSCPHSPPRETFGNSQLDKGLRYESKMRSELEDPVGDLASILMWN